MTCENKNIIYNDMEYNRYITDDRNLGKVFPKKFQIL